MILPNDDIKIIAPILDEYGIEPHINASDNTSIILKNKDGQVIGVYYSVITKE